MSQEGRLLIVEDNVFNRHISKDILNLLKFPYREALDGEEAWKMLRQSIEPSGEPIVAVLADIVMPKMDGMQLLAKIKAHPKLTSIPVILMTASDDLNFLREAQNYKISGYIRKPLTFESLLRNLKLALPDNQFPELKTMD